jgi:trehalose-6-phosphate synthase
VNPYDMAGLGDAMHQALAMPVEEQARRMRSMRAQVVSYDVSTWAQGFLSELS